MIRAWRMGQKRNVFVKRFYVKDSVEENIMHFASNSLNLSKGRERITVDEIDRLFRGSI